MKRIMNGMLAAILISCGMMMVSNKKSVYQE